MDIHTKYNVGDIVWIMSSNEPSRFEVTSIKISNIVSDNIPMPLYELFCAEDNHQFMGKCLTEHEHKVFATKKDLVGSFLKD